MALEQAPRRRGQVVGALGAPAPVERAASRASLSYGTGMRSASGGASRPKSGQLTARPLIAASHSEPRTQGWSGAVRRRLLTRSRSWRNEALSESQRPQISRSRHQANAPRASAIAEAIQMLNTHVSVARRRTAEPIAYSTTAAATGTRSQGRQAVVCHA